jgi:formate dehydrogenase major subunit
MAECHPVAYRFVMEAKERGAKIIHVDPRFTRTSATANMYAPIRTGTDIVFLGGIINYLIQNELYFKDYVLNYTNASFLVNEDFKGTDNDLSGLFSGYEPDKQNYDRTTWQYDVSEPNQAGRLPQQGVEESRRDESEGHSQQEQSGTRVGPPLRDMTLSDPLSVFQILKRHFSRYTPEMVERVCGTPRDMFIEIAKTLATNSGRDKTTAFCYAVGFTQHSIGVQMIRSAAILQLLLGNIGRPGGGILALRGHATIQGSTDIPTLYNLLPGYLQVPTETLKQYSLADYLKANYSATGWWHNMPKYAISLLKAFYGEHATKENDYAFHYLPKINGDYSYNKMFFDMKDGKIKGFFVMGENIGVGGINARLQVEAMQKLDWCVVRELYPVEMVDFWKFNGADPKTIGTEVFLMPAAAVAEKDGSYTNTQRMVQWHDKAVDPPGDARSETWFMYHLGRRLKELYKDSTLNRDKPIQHLQWNLRIKKGEEHLQEPDLFDVALEISGYDVNTRKPLAGFADLKDDGSTACGCWIYGGMVAPDGTNRAANRKGDPVGVSLGDPNFTNHSGWGFAWPANRRILYNRASADPDGQPWSERKKLVWWQPETEDGQPSGGEQSAGEQHGDETTRRSSKGKWVGYDVPDFPVAKAPWTPDNPQGLGMEAHSGAAPFIMMADGVGQLFVPNGLADGPLPTHYESLESPIKNPVYKQQVNPTEKFYPRPDNPLNPSLTEEYPYICTTYRLTEHHTSGAMSRWVPWLSELQPELFAEINPVMAQELGLENGDWATVRTSRGELELRVLVTHRMTPLMIDGKMIHQIGLPYHWGSRGLVTGDTVNNMIPLTADPNVHIHEAKTFTANMRKGRRSQPVDSEPVSSDGVTVPRGGEAGQLAQEVHLGVTDVMRHQNNSAADGQSPAAREAAGQGRAAND